MLERSDIENILPHRGQFLLIDKVISNNENELTCTAKLRSDLDIFKYHFGVYPGVYLAEAIGQAGAIKLRLDQAGSREVAAYYMLKIEKATFRHPVKPGDEVTYEVTTKDVGSGFLIEGKACVGDKVCATAIIIGTAR